MKKIFLSLLSVIALATAADAQKKTSGAIQFENTIDPATMASASGMQLNDAMKARMPSASKSNYELLFTATNASYMPVEEMEDSNGGGGGGGGFGRMMMRFGGGSREYYYTFADKSVAQVFDVSDTTYYIPTKLNLSATSMLPNFRMGGSRQDSSKTPQTPPPAPKIEVVETTNTKKIIGFDCKEVIVKSTRSMKILDMDKDVTEETHLWYTTDLGFDFSPNPNLWTKGAVLAIEGRGNSVVATSMEYRGVSAKDVTAPKKATLITEEAYRAKMEAQMKRIRSRMGNGGSGGGIQIRTFGN
ncbi:hypothetical protein [Pedobacter sp. MW01-1-1]|uniref:hypothetical protein n=1 Tax=Pedobacter sp. MW01-1-1 TaxID=3383027 RepID=UPI003FEF3758